MNRYEIKHNSKYRLIARQLLKERSDLRDIAEAAPKVAYVESLQEKTTGSGTRKVLGECKKVPDNMQWCCPYHFIITIYKINCAGMTPEQIKILIWHELKHIGIKLDGADEDIFYNKPHDYEEFKDIIDAYGLDWSDV